MITSAARTELEESILADEKRQIILKPEGMPEDVYEVGRDYSTRFYYVRGYIRCQVIARLKFRDPRGNYYHVNLPEKYKRRICFRRSGGKNKHIFWSEEAATREGSDCGKVKASFVLAGGGSNPGGQCLRREQSKLCSGQGS